MTIWRCQRCHSTLWAPEDGLRKCLRCDLLSDTAADDPDYEQTVTVEVFIECDACGHREPVADEAAAKKVIADHVKGCRKAHKGLRKS